MDEMYAKYRAVFVIVIQAQPNAEAIGDRSASSVYVCCYRGPYGVYGHNKPWQQDTQKIADLAVLSYLHLTDEAG